jgi:ribosomal protein S18 acetylase RimI-like enzyme
MTIQVRVALATDIGTIVRLNRDVQLAHAEIEPAFFKAATNDVAVAAFFAARLERPENHFRLAEVEGDPAGYIWFEIQESTETALTQPRRRVYVHHISVRDAMRRRGIASALLHQADGEALARGITTVTLGVWAANGPALRFFEARGFTPSQITLSRRLT